MAKSKDTAPIEPADEPTVDVEPGDGLVEARTTFTPHEVTRVSQAEYDYLESAGLLVLDAIVEPSEAASPDNAEGGELGQVEHADGRVETGIITDETKEVGP